MKTPEQLEQRRYNQAVKELRKSRLKYDAGGFEYVKKESPNRSPWKKYLVLQYKILVEKGYVKFREPT